MVPFVAAGHCETPSLVSLVTPLFEEPGFCPYSPIPILFASSWNSFSKTLDGLLCSKNPSILTKRDWVVIFQLRGNLLQLLLSILTKEFVEHIPLCCDVNNFSNFSLV